VQKKYVIRGLMLAGVSAVVLGLYSAGDSRLMSQATAASPETAAAPQSLATLPDFSKLVTDVERTVVQVQISRAGPMTQDPRGEAPGGDDEKRSPFPFPFPMPDRDMPQQGSGSGFIVSADGYVMTNAHVVANADDITVVLKDKQEYKAKVIGLDRRTDVALIKIDAKDLPVAKIGDPEKMKVGEWVAAIGAPFGLESTVTVGIVSAKSRSLPNEAYVPFIQTDAAVNPGNSGGPLFNLRGEVIGINSQIFSRTGGYMGLAFAIPIDLAMSVKDDLQQHGKVTRGKIGVAIQDLNKELAASFGLTKAEGALVSSVEKGSPAEANGLMPGDVIVKVNDKTVAKAGDASRHIGALKPGQTAKLEVWRDRAVKSVDIKLAEMPGDTLASATQGEAKPMKLGVMVRPLSEQEKSKLGDMKGVVVEQSSGPAARAGIQRGDMILAINNQPVESAEDLKRLVDKAGNSAALLIERDGKRLFVPITFG
jgi:serine protease Do